MSILAEINQNLQNGRVKAVATLVKEALEANIAPKDIMQSLLDGMTVIGEKFKNDEVFVPEVLISARAMTKGIDLLKPYLKEDDVQVKGKACIGTVQGDQHDIGKNLVKLMLESKGIEVIDLGVNVSPEAFVQTAIDQDCDIICCSALLTTTMTVMADVVKLAEEKGIRDKVKIMVGGAPVDEKFAASIGADKYTADAASAADAAVAFLS